MKVLLLNVALDVVVLDTISRVYHYFLLSYQNGGNLLHPLAPFDLLYSMLRMVANNLVLKIYFPSILHVNLVYKQ